MSETFQKVIPTLSVHVTGILEERASDNTGGNSLKDAGQPFSFSLWVFRLCGVVLYTKRN